MLLIETSFEQIPEGFNHTVVFEFEGRTFSAIVIETKDETLIRDCFQILENLFPIDIPKYFGEYKNDVFSFIYDNIQRGLPETLKIASTDDLVKVEWFDYAKQEKITEDITQEQLKWLKEQSHIEVDKVHLKFD